MFFGRPAAIHRTYLRGLHQYNFVGVTGSSGSGKSIPGTCGLIPKLKQVTLVNESRQMVICYFKTWQKSVVQSADELLVQLPME
jgi:ABC-type dipeptide/oligopeptide/nickel transport system ATPase component